MVTKEKILEEVKRTANENKGIPLGTIRFENETGISPYDWGKYFIRFSDILKEAGFVPNRKALEPLYSTDTLLEKVIEVIRELKKFPLLAELRLKKNQNPNFPYRAITKRLFPRKKLVQVMIDYCKNKKGYEDIIKLGEEVSEKNNNQKDSDEKNKENLGAVYLFKHGKYYKIGKTNDTVRRGNELKIQLPENLDLIHEIKTDDPSGIEAYWHRRFETKRMNGEWFDLTSSDIKAFKLWRRIS